jgi:hypothetical protein
MMRRMLWNRLVVFAIVAAAVGVASAEEGRVRTARLKKRPAPTPPGAVSAVREAIAQETVGDAKQRDSMLDEVLKTSPDFPLARWQRGFVQTQDGWQHVDELAVSTTPSSRDTIYQNHRRKFADDIAGNVELARWCERRAFPESARAHWNRVVSLDANNAEAHRALGDELIDGKWLSQEKQGETKNRAQAIEQAQRTWGRKISEWAEGYAGGSFSKREFSEKKLRQITDPAAVPILAANLSRRDEQCAQLLIQLLRNLSDQEATKALSDLGVRTDSEFVRAAVVSELKLRDEHMVVPPLLLAMSSPVTAEMRLIVTNEGALVYRHVFTAEKLATTAPAQNARLVSFNRPTPEESLIASEMFGSPVESELASRNAAVQRTNQRIGAFLSELTGAPNGKPEDWWKWWNRRQQIEVGDEAPPAIAKPLMVASVMPDQNVVPQMGNIGMIVGGSQRTRKDCFVKGTLVWTSRGKVAIETIRTGDLVLSQNLKTGEIGFKGVIQPTQRPPQKVVELEIGCAKLQCTGGHTFWVPGNGWVKASDLKSGMLVRCADGAEPVLSTKEGQVVETHNLVVADFHSYFVGDEKTLCHDNTDQRPTLAVAPGVYREGEDPRMGR